MDLTLNELEDAINYWRGLRPSVGEENALSQEVNALAEVYALMIVSHSRSLTLESLDGKVRTLLDTWRGQRAA